MMWRNELGWAQQGMHATAFCKGDGTLNDAYDDLRSMDA